MSENAVQQFTDQLPPGTSANRILKTPRGAAPIDARPQAVATLEGEEAPSPACSELGCAL